MSTLYEVTLTPLDSFYFGGEESFASPLPNAVVSKDKAAQNYFKKRQGYFAKSEMFPQQTQILGMLRKELLKLNGFLKHYKRYETVDPSQKAKATRLVGSAWSPKGKINLGMIEQLSPLFLRHNANGKLYLPLPFDKGYAPQTQGVAYINDKAKAAVYFKNLCEADRYFGAKDALCNDFMSLDGEIADIDEIFIPTVQTHTQTGNYKEDDDEKYFKVKRYCLKAYSFCFCLSFANDSFLKDNYTATVSLGGERSYFRMHITKTDKTMQDLDREIDTAYHQQLQAPQPKIVLLSDAYIDPNDNIFEYTIASMASKKALRFLQSGSEDKDKSKYWHFKKSQKKMMLTRGSIFYPKDKDASQKIIDAIEKQKNFRLIGYNRYTTIKGERS